MTIKLNYQEVLDSLPHAKADHIEAYVYHLEQTIEKLEKELDYLEQGMYNGNMKRKKPSWDDER